METGVYIMQDQVDIYEFINTLIKRKKLVLSVSLIFTLSAIAYIATAKPIYGGKATIEIGQVLNSDLNMPFFKLFDEAKDLRFIIRKMTKVHVRIPRDTQLLQLSAEGSSKKVVQDKLEDCIHFITDRHKEISKTYAGKDSKIRMTQLIGTIDVYENPIKPKKKLIVGASLVTAFLFSIFLVFFLDFLANSKALFKI